MCIGQIIVSHKSILKCVDRFKNSELMFHGKNKPVLLIKDTIIYSDDHHLRKEKC